MTSKTMSRQRELEALSRLLSAAERCADDVGAQALSKLIQQAAALAEKEVALSQWTYHA